MADAPRIPGAPDHTQPVPRDPVSGFDLEAYATIAGRLAARADRAATLRAAGLDELRWLDVESTWLLRIAVAALREERDLLEQYDAALLRAKSGSAPAVAERSPTG